MTNILSSELYQQCRNVLLKCSEFDTFEQLKSVFITSELKPYQDDLPQANSSSKLVDLFLSYILDKKLDDGRYVFPLFLQVLAIRYHPPDELHFLLTQLHESFSITLATQGEKSETNQIGDQEEVISIDEVTMEMLVKQVGEAYGTNALRLLVKLLDYAGSKNKSKIFELLAWIRTLISEPTHPELNQEPLAWLLVVLDQHIRLGVDQMNFDELPPTDSQAAHFFKMSAIQIEGLSLQLSKYHDINWNFKLNDPRILDSTRCLRDVQDEVQKVYNLLERYISPLTILPDNFQYDKFTEAVNQLTRLFQGLKAHIAINRSISSDYRSRLNRYYDDFYFFAGCFIDWLHNLENKADHIQRIF